jgi:hypothetical protein
MDGYTNRNAKVTMAKGHRFFNWKRLGDAVIGLRRVGKACKINQAWDC